MVSKESILIHICIICSSVGLILGKLADLDMKLELVQVLFRHGARTPFPKEVKFLSKFNESYYEPWGISQLTKEGMNIEYEIGKMLRERYNDFLPNLYQPRHVYAYSSDTARTKASLGLVLAALYPPVGDLKWNDKLNWMPIPIHSSPLKLDILINSRICPTFLQEFDKVLETETVIESLSAYDQVFKTLKEVYGNLLSLEDTSRVYNLIKIHKELNLPLPHWYTDEICEKLKIMSELYMDLQSSTDTLKKLNGGPLVKTLLENIHNSNESRYKKKIYLYSAHEKNVYAYIKSHNINEQRQPDYGGTVILETYKDSNNKVYIKLLYWNGIPKELKTLKLPDCPEMCSLEKYSEIIKSVLPSEDEMLCLIKNATSKDLEKYFYNTNKSEY